MANLFRLSFFIICVVILQITSANPVDQNNTDGKIIINPSTSENVKPLYFNSILILFN